MVENAAAPSREQPSTTTDAAAADVDAAALNDLLSASTFDVAGTRGSGARAMTIYDVTVVLDMSDDARYDCVKLTVTTEETRSARARSPS